MCGHGVAWQCQQLQGTLLHFAVKVGEKWGCEQRRCDLRQEHGRRGDTHAQQAKTNLRVDAGERGDALRISIQRVAHESVDELVRAHRRPSNLEAVRDDAQIRFFKKYISLMKNDNHRGIRWSHLQQHVYS